MSKDAFIFKNLPIDFLINNYEASGQKIIQTIHFPDWVPLLNCHLEYRENYKYFSISYKLIQSSTIICDRIY